MATGAEFAPDAVVTYGVNAQLVGEAIARRAHAVHVYNEHTPLTPTASCSPSGRTSGCSPGWSHARRTR